jgi:enolase
LGDNVFVIGDDLVTTNDQTIETASSQGLINAVLIKANQIGSLYETLLAMLVALGKGMDLVVSHRSKSPNDDMEAQIALAVNALGLKAGGGANTERLIKYQAVTELMLKVAESEGGNALRDGETAVVRKLRAYEEPTNAGIPTVGVTLELGIPTAGVVLKFKGATPLGTSAGTGEAIHLVDGVIEQAEHREVLGRFPSFFEQVEPGVFSFSGGTKEATVRSTHDEGLTALYERTQRYRGKGCLSAVDNVKQIIAPHFEGLDVADLSLKEIDTALLELELTTARRRRKLDDASDPSHRVTVMQRKQNLGMNAMLSASLALARALAHVQGKELYELLREEMLGIIDALAGQFDIEVQGSRFADYVAALRKANEILEGNNESLYEALRDLTGIYAPADGQRPKRDVPQPVPATEFEPPVVSEVEDISSTPPVSEQLSRPAAKSIEVALPETFTSSEEEILSAFNHQLYRAYVVRDGKVDLKKALSIYQQTRADLTQRVARFGIVNNRIFQHDEKLWIPYLLGNTLMLHLVRGESTEAASVRRFPSGTIYTDSLLQELADAGGVPIDLEQFLFAFDAERVTEPRISRIRDIASLLQEVNEASNRNEALHLLRHLVARLCNLSVKTFLGAKNLQPEVNNLNTQLLRFINGWLCPSLPGLTRTVVRNLSSVIGKPNLIDQLWNDTIRLAEVEVRGSAIVNELRRSSHHALGQRTMHLAETYLDFLE